MRWVTSTHAMRYHAHYHSSGEGNVYQGRFKRFRTMGISFPSAAKWNAMRCERNSLNVPSSGGGGRCGDGGKNRTQPIAVINLADSAPSALVRAGQRSA